ncbi:ZF-HD dimerization-type domain-containing protein [Psidium guajava]|nr:ZF-HD dimerization-type domain-containing protein [Psidium guajava]
MKRVQVVVEKGSSASSRRRGETIRYGECEKKPSGIDRRARGGWLPGVHGSWRGRHQRRPHLRSLWLPPELPQKASGGQ